MSRVLLVDAGGVLHQSNDAVSHELMCRLCIRPELVPAIWAGPMVELGSGKIDERAFWQQVRVMTRCRMVTPDEDLLGRPFAEALVPNLEILEIIKAVKQQGIRVAVFSNTIEPHARVLRQRGIYPTDELYLSHEIKLRKPLPQAYQYVLEQLGVPAECVLFVDDDERNITAAGEVHMRTCWYRGSPANLRQGLGEQLSVIL